VPGPTTHGVGYATRWIDGSGVDLGVSFVTYEFGVGIGDGRWVRDETATFEFDPFSAALSWARELEPLPY
jgi:hypothetical protein